MAAEIEGLAWLENTRDVDAVVIDEGGFPVRLVVPHPHVFAAHKLWVSERSDRDPLKRGRDRTQALLVADLLCHRRPDLILDNNDLTAVPAALVERLASLLRPPAPPRGGANSTPDW